MVVVVLTPLPELRAQWNTLAHRAGTGTLTPSEQVYAVELALELAKRNGWLDPAPQLPPHALAALPQWEAEQTEAHLLAGWMAAQEKKRRWPEYREMRCECPTCGQSHRPTPKPYTPPPRRPAQHAFTRATNDRSLQEPTPAAMRAHRRMLDALPRKPLYYAGPITRRDGTEYVLRDGNEVPLNTPPPVATWTHERMTTDATPRTT